MANKFLIPALVALVFSLSSCKSYYIPVDSFKQQFAGMNASDMREVTTEGPTGIRVKYKTYPIDYIHAIDEEGNPVTIRNSPSIEIRFTDSSNKRSVFYFDLLRFDGKNISGGQSRMIPAIKKSIPIDRVKKIEVQDGKKRYRYVN